MDRSEGFPPVSAPDARILILGSLPGRRSIAEQQYYAHPQNAFWPIMRDVYGINGDYASRCESLIRQRVALWDVLHSSVRPGSLDSAIRLQSAALNDFTRFFVQHRHIEQVLCNGRKAGQMFTRLVAPELVRAPPVRVMPSTSPAFASMPYSEKLRQWRAALTDCK